MTNKEESKNEEAHIIVDGKKKNTLTSREYYTNTRGWCYVDEKGKEKLYCSHEGIQLITLRFLLMSKGKPLHKVFFCEKCYTEDELVADLPVDEIDLERGREFNIHKDLG
jgi:hypothetical protein